MYKIGSLFIRLKLSFFITNAKWSCLAKVAGSSSSHKVHASTSRPRSDLDSIQQVEWHKCLHLWSRHTEKLFQCLRLKRPTQMQPKVSKEASNLWGLECSQKSDQDRQPPDQNHGQQVCNALSHPACESSPNERKLHDKVCVDPKVPTVNHGFHLFLHASDLKFLWKLGFISKERVLQALCQQKFFFILVHRSRNFESMHGVNRWNSIVASPRLLEQPWVWWKIKSSHSCNREYTRKSLHLGTRSSFFRFMFMFAFQGCSRIKTRARMKVLSSGETSSCLWARDGEESGAPFNQQVNQVIRKWALWLYVVIQRLFGSQVFLGCSLRQWLRIILGKWKYESVCLFHSWNQWDPKVWLWCFAKVQSSTVLTECFAGCSWSWKRRRNQRQSACRTPYRVQARFHHAMKVESFRHLQQETSTSAEKSWGPCQKLLVRQEP